MGSAEGNLELVIFDGTVGPKSSRHVVVDSCVIIDSPLWSVTQEYFGFSITDFKTVFCHTACPFCAMTADTDEVLNSRVVPTAFEEEIVSAQLIHKT